MELETRGGVSMKRGEVEGPRKKYEEKLFNEIIVVLIYVTEQLITINYRLRKIFQRFH